VAEADLDATRHGGDEIARELHALGAQIASLQADVRRLQSVPLPGDGGAGWEETPPAPVSFRWISAIEPPRRTALRFPRLPFELAFVAGAAALAGVAHLRPLVIAAVMGGTWVVVALGEWAATRGERIRRQLLLAAPSREAEHEPPLADPAWFTPPVEHTLLARGQATTLPSAQQTAGTGEPESETMVARLPGAPESETTVERRPGP
jgi:hypothetical protein